MILALVLMVAMPMKAERVTPETARKVATTFLNNNGAKAAQLTDLSKAAGFPNLYIFTAEQGFVVMATDDCVQPILGYSLTGTFVAENMPENFRWWLQGYSDEIQFAIDNKTRASSKTAKMWKDLTEGKGNVAKATNVVNPLIQTKWNQNKYYNNLCPQVSDGIDGHAYTGCVATAMAQIMKYWNYPSTGIGSHSYTWNGQTLSANFGATTYDWNNMVDYYEYYYTNGTDQYPNWLPEPSAEEIAAVATLMYHCGVSVEMNYGGNSTGGSSAAIFYVANALKTYFNYKSTAQFKQKSYNSIVYYTDDEWIAMLKAELDSNRPMQYGGQDPNGNSGHAFVCDGYNSDDYFHFNWGWAGHYNGYFSINNLDTGANSGEAGAGNGVYTRDQEAVIGIEPGSMLPAPTNLTYTINGSNDIVLTWDAVNAAASYNVYRDGSFIGNTVENTYSETAPFGTHSYYVRCVDTNSQLSLFSNTITITIDYPTPVVDDLMATLSGNNVNLSWTEPEWCAPNSDDEVLTYSYGNTVYHFGSGSGISFYYGHKYPASMINTNKVLYKVSFLVFEIGAYELHVYTGNSGSSKPSTQIHSQSITVSMSGWNEVVISNPIQLDADKDLWVFIYDPVGRDYPMGAGSFEGSNTNGNYLSSNPISSVWPQEVVMLINTYITDGNYTYNLYDGTTSIASNLSSTNYTVNNITNNTAHCYTLKTNYYGGETGPSNMAGITLGTASLSSLQMAANDKMTITENSTLTVSGTLTNNDPANLILEEGAQLIHNSANVKATVKKTIQPYNPDGSDGWNFIASPVTESFEPGINNGLLTNNYDLYKFDQSQELEWRNIKAGSFSNIEHKTGYLYANSGNTTLTFAGTLVATTEPTVLAFDANASLKGFNLIGNPYPCNTTIANDFYIISNNLVNLAENGTTIAPCESVFVKATGTGESVTFTKPGSAKGSSSKDCFDLVIMQDKANTDRARVRLGEGIGMEKYTLNPDNTQISLRQNGQDFAVAYANGQDEMQLNFKAKRDGIYTLSIELGSLDLGYLHLIDNLTGNEINLLETPSYTFQATTSDYASRFRLLFAPADETDYIANDFAFFADGHLHVFNQGKVSLQLIDMMGHILLTETLQGNFDKALDLVPGVYVVRLISEKTESSMKFVVD
jgi:fibronectin type 3 domain-containing protein